MDAKATLLDGISLNSIWTFICIGFALIGVFLVIAKFVDQIQKWVKEHKDKKALGKQDITEEIASKVTEKLTPQINERFQAFETSFDEKFKEIDRKLATDKEDIESHTHQLNDHEGRVSKLEGGDKSLCQAMLALLEKDPSQEKAAHAMKNYIINGKYNERDWE